MAGSARGLVGVLGVEGSGAAKENFGFVRTENLGEFQPKRDR